MAKFEYKGATFHVGEMSRAAAFGYARDVRLLPDEVQRDEDVLWSLLAGWAAVYAPTVVELDGRLVREGELRLGEGLDQLTITLPITREAFETLPISLALDWETAAVDSNQVAIALLKNSLRRTARPIEPPSASAPSNASSEPAALATIKTTGD